MSVRSALGSLSSWPTLVIAPILILVVGALHYGPVYRQRMRLAEARAGFSAAVARAMIAQGRLGILAFAKAAEVVDYIEFRADRASFEEGGEAVARGDAVFTVGSPDGAGGPFILRLPPSNT